MIERFVSSQALILLFLFFALTIAVIIKQIRKNCSYVPYTPTLFMISVLLGYFADDIGIIGQSIKSMSFIDPRGILIIFLPPLIFESAFSSDLYTFKKQSTQIFILAFPSVLCSALILMLSLKLIIGYDDTYYTWAQAFMFGSILSCTDTVAVLALLKQAGAPKKFNSLIQGQSLFNDGTCMVLFIISLQLVKGSTPHILEIILLFFQLTVGAIILGIIFGFLSTSLIKIVYNDDILVLNTTVVFCYLLYFIAQYVDFGIRISGIMALVSMGLYMAAFGKTKFTPQARQTVNRFWKIFVFIAETIIFILGGVLVGVKALDKNNVITIIGSTDIINVIILYFSMFLARGLSITIFMPKLQKQGYGLKWNQVIALTYGGIRGAVGIAFTLILASNVNLPDKLKKVCLFNMAGCSFLTLLINASTMSFLIKKIGLSIKSDIKVKLFTKFMKQFQNNLQLRLHEMQKDKHLQNSDWQQVQYQSGLKQLQNMIQINLHKNNKKQLNMHHGINQYLIGDQIINQNFDAKLMSEIRNCFCVALKGICWQKFQNNQCSCESIKNLIECIDLDLDTIDQALNSWQFLLNHIHNPIYFPILFWLRQFHFLKNFANSQIFYHTQILYDVISTYIECMKQCQIACKQFPFDEQYLNEINKQCNKNCNYAKNYLKDEIQIVFPDIMKKIQIDKAAQSILSFQKQILNDTYNHGQIDQLFFKQLKQNIQIYIKKIQNDNGIQQILTDQQILKKNNFFLYMSSKNLKYLLSEKIEITIQKDQPLIKNYQKQKFLYFIIRGAMIEEWKQNNKSIYFRNISIHQIAGQSTLILNNYKQLSMYINATSIVCLYCFPLSIIKQILLNQPQLECYFWIDLLPLVINLIPSINLKFISFDFFMKVKSEIKFIQLKEQQYELINNKFIIVIEGKVEIKNIEYKQGYYQSNQNNIKIIGPGKFYISSYKLTQEINKDRKSINSDIRTSIKKRKSLRSNSGSIFKKTLFTKD